MNSKLTVVMAGAIAAALTLPLGAANATWSGSSGKDGKTSGTAVGLAGGTTLVGFKLDKPERAQKLGTVTGLAGDTALVGIDYRVQDRKLYAVGNQGGIYTIATKSGKVVATKVSQLTVALSGTSFGVDFNPAADRLRVVSDTGQNLRHDVNPGGATIVDGTLTAPPATAAVRGVSGAAYTNNDLDADTATTLFDLDTALDQVAIQAPANAGPLSATGKLGVDATGDAGFDVAGKKNTGWATLKVNGTYALYEVSLLTGEVDKEGSFPRSVQVSDLAVPIGR